jgi:cobalt-zinc-cadmium resistance protein CzcA
MIERIIHFSIKNKLIVGLFIAALTGWGIYSLTQLPVDAIPDITNNQVQVIALAPSLAVEEVESTVTAPVEVALANIPGIEELRSISRLGLSVVTVVFDDDVDVYWARQQMSERLKEAEEAIPPGVAKIELAPVSTGLGEIYQYRLRVDKGFQKKYDAMELRTLQDWVVRRRMLGTPGVADVNSYGGFVKQYEVAVQPERMRALNLTLTDIFDALERNNENTGSAYIEKGQASYFIRGIGLVKNLDEIGKIVVKNGAGGMPVLVRDVATVQYGSATRYGAFVIDTTEAVGGVVMMLKGGNAREVVKKVEERVASIQQSLPEGVHIEPFLNRSDLVDRAVNTVSRNLIEGALIVVFVLVLLLGNWRAGLIVASVIPLSMLFAISMMRLFGVSGNLMSLGAIDFGLIVDGAVIIVESVVHRISRFHKLNPGVTQLSQQQMNENVLMSAKRMMSSATFGQVIILIVYLPVMALVGVEGKMFRPMAEVVTFALIGAAILSLTYVPVASALFLSKSTTHKPSISDRLLDKLHRLYQPLIGMALARKRMVMFASVLLFVASLLLFNRLGGEFIPQLEEGDLAAGVITLQGGSLSNTVDVVKKANQLLLDNFPEIKHTVCKIGAGEIPTDPTPMETGDYIITLKDKSEWTSADTREELVEKMEEKLSVLAGVKFEFQQPIQMRFNELLSGSKQDIAIKIFGDDLPTLAKKAEQVEHIISGVDGVSDINVEKVTGLAQVQVSFDRDRLAQYGLSVGEANRVLRTAFAGTSAGVVFDREQRFPLVVRLDKDYRQNLDDVKNLSLQLPGGGQITLDQIANVTIQSGPAQVSREETRRRITIGFNVRDRDVKSVIDEVQQKIGEEISLPTGYYFEYGGQFQNLEAAKKRLAIAVPIALLLIFLLLYFTFRSVKQALLIYSAVPMAAIGGVLALWLREMNFSISAGVGFIALFGVAVLNGIVLIAEFNRLEKEGITDIRERIFKGLHARLRPVLMTAAVASLGFIPMAVSGSAGAEVQRPLATVVIGGLITATLLTLFVLPVLYAWFASPRRFQFPRFKKRSVATAIMVLMIVSSVMAAGEKPLTVDLKQALQLALENNRSIRASEYEVGVLKAKKGAAWDIPKTTLEGEYGQMNSYRKDNSFTVSQSMAFPTVYINQSRLVGAEVKSGEWQLKSMQLDIATQVKHLYWQLVYLNARNGLLLRQDSLYSGFLKAAELRATVGETNRLEMITARSQALETKNQLRQNQADRNIAANKLQLLLGVGQSAETIRIADTLLRKIDYLPVTDKVRLEANPALGYAEQQTAVSAVNRNLEVSKLLPEFSFGYTSQTMLGTEGSAGKIYGSADRFSGIKAGVSIPLWFGASSAKIKAARVAEKASRANVDAVRLSLESSYRNLLLEYEKYAGSVDFYEKQAVKEADLIIDQATAAYKGGAMEYSDYIQSLSRALTIRQNYLDALNNYNQTVVEIEQITGKIQ